MTLREIRDQFRQISGRYDLVDAAGRNNGSDYYIKAGIRHLDRVTQFSKASGSMYKKVPEGTYLVQIPDARSVSTVYIGDQEARKKLDKLSYAQLREKYPAKNTEVTPGIPLYYTPISLRPIPDHLTSQMQADLDWITEYMDVVAQDHYKVNGVLIFPPTSGEMMVQVEGKYYSRELVYDTDKNFWTEVHPELVVTSAMLQLEIAHRNFQGVKDCVSAIDLMASEISKDLAAEESDEELLRMEG